MEEGTCHGKNTGKDHVEEEAPAEVEPLEAWSPMTLWRALKKSPHGNINIPQKQ
ncbi:MAG: hypothetical protein MR966_03240 [Lachnospiraceae bacterium]|nr:hypothetical protein [Lachnospiraceae bacterium]